MASSLLEEVPIESILVLFLASLHQRGSYWCLIRRTIWSFWRLVLIALNARRLKGLIVRLAFDSSFSLLLSYGGFIIW